MDDIITALEAPAIAHFTSVLRENVAGEVVANSASVRLLPDNNADYLGSSNGIEKLTGSFFIYCYYEPNTGIDQSLLDFAVLRSQYNGNLQSGTQIVNIEQCVKLEGYNHSGWYIMPVLIRYYSFLAR